MKYAVVYSSKTGNTKMLADSVKEILAQKTGADVYFNTAVDSAADLDAEFIFAGFWCDKGDCDEAMIRFLESLRSKQVFLFGTAGFGGGSDYFESLLAKAAGHLDRSNQVAGTWMCQGKMEAAVKNRYEALIRENPEDENLKGMLANFDRAASHPDARDLQEFKEAVERMLL